MYHGKDEEDVNEDSDEEDSHIDYNNIKLLKICVNTVILTICSVRKRFLW